MTLTHRGESVLHTNSKGGLKLDEVAAVRRLQGGDQSALDYLFGVYVRPAIRTAYLITRNRTAAEDAVQEAFVQVLRNIATLRDVTAFRSWFYRIVINAAKRLSRIGSVPTVSLDLESHDRADATIPAPDEVALTSEEVARLRVAIGELNEAHRVPVFLRYFTGLSEQEIAHALGLPPGTVKSRLHNARKRLFERLEGATKPMVIPVAARPAECTPGQKE